MSHVDCWVVPLKNSLACNYNEFWPGNKHMYCYNSNDFGHKSYFLNVTFHENWQIYRHLTLFYVLEINLYFYYINGKKNAGLLFYILLYVYDCLKFIQCEIFFSLFFKVPVSVMSVFMCISIKGVMSVYMCACVCGYPHLWRCWFSSSVYAVSGLREHVY